MAAIKDNLAALQARVDAALARSGRPLGAARIVAVSKFQPVARIEEAAAAGMTVFAESRIQEARTKLPALAALGQWHLIGHVQTNKAKSAVELFDCVQSVDSLHLAEELSKVAQRQGKTLPVFCEVNISGEDQKHGMPADQAYDLAQRVAALPGLKVAGLMCMAPLADDPQATRPVFAGLRGLGGRLEAPLGRLELSMGMSNDFEVAVEEGATLVRIGTALFA